MFTYSDNEGLNDEHHIFELEIRNTKLTKKNLKKWRWFSIAITMQ